MKKAILFRLGGFGDLLILGPVAKQLKARGYSVDGCLGSPTCDIRKILGNLDLFDNIFLYGKMFNGVDAYEAENKDQHTTGLLKFGYDLVVDYKRSVELNSHYGDLSKSGQAKEWFQSQSSNYVNWMDIMLGWANIDPNEVSDEDKRPIYKMEPNEIEWAESVVGKGTVVAMQTSASSLVRTWYHPDRLPKELKSRIPDASYLVFDGQSWKLIRGGTVMPVLVPEGMEPMRASVALVGASSIFVGADSGLAHAAEAVGTPHVTIYTTVPAWTRMKYYKHCYPIEPVGKEFEGVECRPCFILDRYCPRIKDKAFAALSDRERVIWDKAIQGIPPETVAREFNTTPQGIIMEHEMVQKRLQAMFEEQAPCTTTITADIVADKVMEVLKCA